jgi:DNA-binding response OmpR family regulator
MTSRPTFTVAVTGLDPQHLRLIEIVFRHIQYNRFVFRLAVAGELDSADILIAGVGDPHGREVLDRTRAQRPGVPTIAAIGPDEAAGTRHAIEIGQLTRQLLPILNRVVEIERLDDPARPAGSLRAASAGGGPDGSRRPPPRVLVIDDSAAMRTHLAGAFERMGVAVESAASGSEAISRLSASPVDLAMLDLVLPDTDGLSLARRIRREARWRLLPIVVLSSRSSALDVIRGAAAGCSAYLAKPVEFGDLQRTIAQQLGRVLHADALPPQLRAAAPRRSLSPGRDGRPLFPRLASPPSSR